MENSGRQHDKSASYADTFTAQGLRITEGGKVKGSKESRVKYPAECREGFALTSAWRLKAPFSPHWYGRLSMSEVRISHVTAHETVIT